MKRYYQSEWGTYILVTLLATATFVDMFLFHSLSNLPRLLLRHPTHFLKSSVINMKSAVLPDRFSFRNQPATCSLFDLRLAEVIYDNETVHLPSRRNQVHQYQYPQGSLRVKRSLPSSLPDLSVVQAPRPFQPKTQPEKVSSWYRALEQVNALFDLAVELGDNIRPTVSNDLVLTALESFVYRVRISVQEGSNSGEFLENFTGLSSAVEALVCRVNEVYTSPTLSTVESVWWILQQERQNDAMASEVSRRSIHLLRNWTAWSDLVGTPMYGRPPPMQLVMQPFRDSTIMSTDLWEFYLLLIRRTPTSHWGNNKSCQTIENPSEVPFYELSRVVLHLLSRSGLEWEFRQCQVIQRFFPTSSKFEPNLPDRTFALLTNEVWCALYASAKAGCVSDTAWLARLIMSATPEFCETAITEIQMVVFESMLHSQDSGSLYFMERLLWQHQRDCKWSVPLNGRTCHMLLSKYAQTAAMNPHYSTASIGRRAERFMHRAYQKLYNIQWHPDVACASFVLEAYLPKTVSSMTNATLLLSRVRKADYFVRNFVRQFNLQPSIGENGVESSYRLFERLFDAYNDVLLISFYIDDKVSRVNATRIAIQADALFRFFLVQHRDGRIRTEIPRESHLQQLTRLLRNCLRANATVMIDIPAQVREYRYILQQTASKVQTKNN